MFTYQMYIKTKSTDWEELTDWIRPFFDTSTLDESLDSGNIRLSFGRRAEPLKPFTRIKIEVWQDEVLKDTIHRLVINDIVTIRRMQPFPLYDHEIQIVELTKLLEREVCDSMTVTNYLGRDYGNGEFQMELSVFEETGNAEIKDITRTQKTPDLYGPISEKNLPKRVQVPIWVVTARLGNGAANYLPAKVKVVQPNGDTYYFNNGNIYPKEKFNNAAYPILYYDLTQLGTYQFGIEYFGAGATVPEITYTCSTSISVFSNIPGYTDWTITEVVERLLSAGVTRRQGIETQKYVFYTEQSAKFRSIKSPEFFFTRSTLFEALMTVGGYIHGIPRLIDENRPDGRLSLRFDMLGGNERYPGKMPSFTYEDISYNGDEFCGGLDSPVQNMLNTIDRTAGAVTDPDDGDYKTVRTEAGSVEISENTATITTDLPIYQITKLLCSVPQNDNITVVDITTYVYEAAEYDTLSSYWGEAFPYSKQYALRYAQGENQITGLVFKIEHKSGTGTALGEIAIKNILKAKGVSGSFRVIDLAFSVTYIPIVNARVIAQKPYYDPDRHGNYRIFNQAGNTVESEYYGSNMKGVIARIGNKLYRRTYLFKNYDNIPRCGQILDGMYVALVEKEFDQLCVKATITLTPDYNKLAEYVGVNSNARLYDISEKQSVDRYINYGETCLISHKKYVCGSPTITKQGINSYIRMFGNNEGSATPVYAADLTTFAGREEATSEIRQEARIAQTCISFALGNSMCFSVGMLDNYGAGYQANDDYDAEDAKRAQRLVRYCDALGNLSYIRVLLGSGLWRPTASSQTNGDGEANAYPELHISGEHTFFIPAFDTKTNWLYVSKDSRERLILTLQLHNQSDDRNIVLGEMLTLRNLLIGGYKETDSLAVYFLPNTINALDKVIDVSEGWKGDGISARVDGASTRFSLDEIANNGTETAQSWAIVDENTKRLYIGENIEIAPNGRTETLYFNFMDNAHLESLSVEQ